MTTTKKILHILKSEPDTTTAGLIEALSGDEGTAVVCLYPDRISESAVDWERLVDDIFTYRQVICWW